MGSDRDDSGGGGAEGLPSNIVDLVSKRLLLPRRTPWCRKDPNRPCREALLSRDTGTTRCPYFDDWLGDGRYTCIIEEDLY